MSNPWFELRLKSTSTRNSPVDQKIHGTLTFETTVENMDEWEKLGGLLRTKPPTIHIYGTLQDEVFGVLKDRVKRLEQDLEQYSLRNDYLERELAKYRQR